MDCPSGSVVWPLGQTFVTEGQSITYSCNIGFTMNTLAVNSITCQSDGTLSATLANQNIECFAMCNTIPTVTGATATVSGQTPVTPIDYNTQVDYTCSSEYSPSTVQSVYCGVTTIGQVDASSVACARKCSSVQTLTEGSVVWPSGQTFVTEGQSISYSCNNGFTMNTLAVNSITCQSDGTLSATLANQNIECFAVCNIIPTVTGATATVSGQTPVTPIDYNTQVDYTCSSEYSPSTVQSVYCGVVTAGQVDASSVACARKCLSVQSLTEGNVVWPVGQTFVTEGQSISYSR